MNLSENEQKLLLQLARTGLEAAAHRQPLPDLETSQLPEALQRPGASFVTLSKNGNLRGCIGALFPEVALALDVLQHGQDAAFDYRFSPVRVEELDDIRIEVSVLSEPHLLEYDSPEKLLEELVPGRDGVLLRHGNRRATFLPQVWRKFEDKQRFLSMLCRKALLPPRAWRRKDVDILVYRVISMKE